MRRDQDRPAQDRFRRAVTEMLKEALTRGASFREIDRLG